MYRRYDFEHMPWFLVAIRPETEASVRRSTAVATWILSLLMLGLLIVALAPQSRHATAAAHQAAPQHQIRLRSQQHSTSAPLPHHG
jgi:hypothetical protein